MSITDVKHMTVLNRRLFREFTRYCAVGAHAVLIATGVLIALTSKITDRGA